MNPYSERETKEKGTDTHGMEGIANGLQGIKEEQRHFEGSRTISPKRKVHLVSPLAKSTADAMNMYARLQKDTFPSS